MGDRNGLAEDMTRVLERIEGDIRLGVVSQTPDSETLPRIAESVVYDPSETTDADRQIRAMPHRCPNRADRHFQDRSSATDRH